MGFTSKCLSDPNLSFKFMEKLDWKRSEQFKGFKLTNPKNRFMFCGDEGTTYLESVKLGFRVPHGSDDLAGTLT